MLNDAPFLLLGLHLHALRTFDFSLCRLRLVPHFEPSSTVVGLEWVDVEPLIGYKVADYIIQHKRIEDPSEAEIYTGRFPGINNFPYSSLAARWGHRRL